MKNVWHHLSRAEHLAFELLDRYWPLVLIVFVLGLLFLLFGGRWIFQKLLATEGRKPKGTRSRSAHRAQSLNGEPEMLSSLKRLSSEHYTTFSDLYLPRPMNEGVTHLDYVVACRQGIFVIQTEEAEGQIFGTAEDKEWFLMQGDKTYPVPNPLWRNAFHLKALAVFLRQPDAIFRSIIYYPGDLEIKSPIAPNVLTTGLGRYIASQPEEMMLSEQMLVQIKATLAAASSGINRKAGRELHRASRRRKSS